MKSSLLLLIALCGMSCASGTMPTPAQSQKQDGPVITRIVGRNEIIVVRAGPDGPTYSSESKDGTVLLKQLTLAQLASIDPQMYRAVKTMEADTSSLADLDLIADER